MPRGGFNFVADFTTTGEVTEGKECLTTTDDAMFENVDQRNADFMKAVEAVSESLAANGRGMTVRQIVGIALLQRPRSFYVTGEYALRRLRAMSAGNAPGEPKVERRMMWCELFQAYTERRLKRPREDERMAIGWVLDNVAPHSFSSRASTPRNSFTPFSGNAAGRTG